MVIAAVYVPLQVNALGSSYRSPFFPKVEGNSKKHHHSQQTDIYPELAVKI